MPSPGARRQACPRRASFLALGGAALAAAATPPAIGEAANKDRKQAEKQCQKQVKQCRNFVTQQCANSMDSAGCEAQLQPCCKRFGECEASKALNCLVGN